MALKPSEMETLHFGKVRGGHNEYALLHVEVASPLSEEEKKAVFVLWDEEFGLKGRGWAPGSWPLNSRREFAILPGLIRKAERLGWDVRVSMWDVGLKGRASLRENPTLFWKAVAMAMAFYGPDLA